MTRLCHVVAILGLVVESSGRTAPPWPIDELIEWADQDVPYRVVRRMPWASVIVWPRPEATVWGKAMCPGFASECRLLPVLARHRPDRVLTPIRVDGDRGLLLLPDGGQVADATISIDAWTSILVGYAELQQDLIGSEAELSASGCVDLRPRQAVDRLARHMTNGRVEERPHLVDWLSRIADELDDTVPATVQHDDLQPSNVLLDGRILDWGDASVGHPFASLLTALMPGNPSRPGDRAARRAMRDTYLRSWAPALGLDPNRSDVMDHLRRQVDLAMVLAPIGRIDTWLRAPAGALDQYPDALDRWVEHLEASAADPRSTAL